MVLQLPGLGEGGTGERGADRDSRAVKKIAPGDRAIHAQLLVAIAAASYLSHDVRPYRGPKRRMAKRRSADGEPDPEMHAASQISPRSAEGRRRRGAG